MKDKASKKNSAQDIKNLGKLVVISGPSGAGKGTIVDRLIDDENIELSVSCTTRKPRDHEKDGVNYFFKREEEFVDMIVSHAFLEYADVFGCKYGTPKTKVLDKLKAGKNVILEIDVKGAMQVKENYPDAMLIFILPPSEQELLRRLRGRNTETEEQIRIRFNTAKEEMDYADKYDYKIINDNLETAVKEIQDIIKRSI